MLQVNNLNLDYGTYRAIQDVSFTVKQGEFFTLLGPSGCGKTSTLRSVAGLETPTGGSIRIGDQAVFDAARRIVIPTSRREISMVFQSYAIWPHMTVFQNVSFPLEAKRARRADIHAKVMRALDVVGLGKVGDRPATQLSGGQQQRVALARAIVKEAKVLLLDEPLSNLDAKLREQMRHELRTMQTQIGTTAIYVTHDQEEALTMSDRIALMHGGKIVELGTPTQLYLTPKSPFTARFLGQANLYACSACDREGRRVRGSTPLGALVSSNMVDDPKHVRWMMVRPEHVEIGAAGSDIPNRLSGQIRSVTFTGRLVEYVIDVSGIELHAVALTAALHEVGETVKIRIPPERVVFLAGDQDVDVEVRKVLEPLRDGQPSASRV